MRGELLLLLILLSFPVCAHLPETMEECEELMMHCQMMTIPPEVSYSEPHTMPYEPMDYDEPSPEELREKGEWMVRERFEQEYLEMQEMQRLKFKEEYFGENIEERPGYITITIPDQITIPIHGLIVGALILTIFILIGMLKKKK